ncbi:MAG: methyltransferase domain-containing protein, partial [Candidatus Omnitrophica bacterium]|nr:methyltransferase domain-containing protein [Candidatus Omnitrophota bacterium]
EQPDLIEWILQGGHEVAFHSYNHQSDWQPKYYFSEIDLCRKVSSVPLGYRSPLSQWDYSSLKSLWKNGFLWNAEDDRHREPYFIYEGLVRLPIAADDWLFYTGALTSDAWVRQFRELLKTRNYFGFGSHDSVVSFAPEERLKNWERVLQIATEDKILLVTFSEAADIFRRAALSRYYTTIAASWNRSTKTLYRTKRFREMVRSEAEKLNQPVIADLGSGGGVLSSPMKDIAKDIYCVDNAPWMVKDVGMDSCIRACTGEVTDSNLPDNSIDLVICARVIEYLFWPDRLADEIRRIGKIGGIYLVTFPAFRGCYILHNGPPPDRIRHYFTSDEIKKWAEQIGPGRLIGIQYSEAEPDSLEIEEQYRAMENNPPRGVYPTNWVYIGIVQKQFTPKHYRKTIPVSMFNFRFPSQWYSYVRIYLKMYLDNAKGLFPRRIRRLIKKILCR